MKAKFLKKGTWKRWLSTVLAVTMVAGVGMSDKVYAGVNGSDSVPENYTSDENGLMAYRYTSEEAGVNDGIHDDYVVVDGIDIMGYVEGEWRGTTYRNRGNTVIFKIDDEIIPVKKIDGSEPIKDGVELYVKVTPSFVSDGQLLKLTYTVENKGRSAVDYSIAGYADAEFNDNDDCPIVNVGEVKNGSAFALNDTDVDKTISFAVFPLSASTSNYHQYWAYQNYFVDGINGYWLDYEYDYDNYVYNELVTEKNLKLEGLNDADSGYSFAWNNQTLGAGESKSYSALFGVGDLENLKAAEEEAAHTHTYGEWEIVTPAGCVDKGSKKRVCSTCGNEETEDINPNGHTVVTDTAVLPTCTTTGLTAGSHCSVCGEIITAQTTVAALGHDWSNDWVVTKPATTVTEGKKECTCKRAGCNQKKYEVIPVIGTPVDPNEGKLDKAAEVAPEAPIEEATLDNTKTELLSAPAIFTAEEKQAIDNGADARVWMEVSKTDESSIPSADKTKISDAATSIMGENPTITYFDADLFKQVGDGAATQLHEPGIDIEVTIKVPENLRNADSSFEREYKIIRLHTDVATGASLVDILSGTFDKITGEFKFKTDKFSTYAIAYTDKKLVTGVTLTPETATLTQAGQSVQLTATVAPADATDKSVTWTSSNTNVATVDANGKVTAVANGTAVITVTTTDGSKTAQSTITVAIATTATKNAISNRIRLNGGIKFSQTGKQLNLSWGKVSAADGYDVYVQYCGMPFKAKSVTHVKNAKTNKLVIKKINGKNINLKKGYKAYVVAYKISKGKKVTLAKSIIVHAVGSKNEKLTNVKSIKLLKNSYTLKKGKTAQIKAKSVLVDSKKKRLSDKHASQFRYTTSNAKVATVTKNGKIKAVGKGICTIYVYAINGYAKKITVTVK